MDNAKEPKRNYLNADYSVWSWLVTTDHKRIAILYMISITLFFFVGGAMAVLIRLELMTPEGDLFIAETYNKLFTMHGVMMDLAHQVVRDGEGATKFVEVSITGAASDADAKTHAMSIANSPLIKTAIAGEDPNWGRVVMAIGKSGAEADRDRLSIRFGDVEVAKDGWRSPEYSEEAAARHMKGQNIIIGVDLGLGKGTATVWTCDLTHGYIAINADYRS